MAQPEVYEIIYSWRDVLDDWKNVHGGETKIMMTEAYANLTFTMRYYESEDGTRKGSHIPFNFLMISDLNENSSAKDFVHTINKWMSYMPAEATANWVVRARTSRIFLLIVIPFELLPLTHSWVIMTTLALVHVTDLNALMR